LQTRRQEFNDLETDFTKKYGSIGQDCSEWHKLLGATKVVELSDIIAICEKYRDIDLAHEIYQVVSDAIQNPQEDLVTCINTIKDIASTNHKSKALNFIREILYAIGMKFILHKDYMLFREMNNITINDSDDTPQHTQDNSN
jgi:hypothetical protein